jgi:Secretion system C-terminal sorting domain
MLRSFTLFFALIGFSSYAQTFYNGFEEGSLEGWTSVAKSGTTIKVSRDNYNYLTLETHSNNEELSLVNNDADYWTGNYFVESSDELILRTVDDILVKNTNDFDLHLRYGFKGANGYTVVTTKPIIIKANSDWEAYSNFYYAFFEAQILDNLTIINDTGSKSWDEIMNDIQDLFKDVVEFKIFHNPEISYEGQKVAGSILLESVVSWDQNSSVLKKLPSLSIFPNPIIDKVQLSSNLPIRAFKIYNAQGAVIVERSLNNFQQEIDVSYLNSGVYLFEVIFQDDTVLSKKLVKQ